MIDNLSALYYTGTSGLLLPVKNKLFYPEEFKAKSRLNFYSSIMNSIEINSSFYKIPMPTTVKKWADDVPADFKFTFKLAKQITHNKALAFDLQTLEHFMEVVNQVGNKKGCILVQLPPSVRINNLKQLVYLLASLRNCDVNRAWNIALECRHVSLYTPELYNILQEYKMGLVIQDKPPANTPMLPIDLDFVYWRFHGPEGDYRGSYNDAILAEYATYITAFLEENKTQYVYFNNTMGNAILNLLSLKDKVQGFENDY